jgi:hypothetical protein
MFSCSAGSAAMLPPTRSLTTVTAARTGVRPQFWGKRAIGLCIGKDPGRLVSCQVRHRLDAAFCPLPVKLCTGLCRLLCVQITPTHARLPQPGPTIPSVHHYALLTICTTTEDQSPVIKQSHHSDREGATASWRYRVTPSRRPFPCCLLMFGSAVTRVTWSRPPTVRHPKYVELPPPVRLTPASTPATWVQGEG